LEALAGERKDIQLLNWTGMLSPDDNSTSL
jgi:hypothetical protein